MRNKYLFGALGLMLGLASAAPAQSANLLGMVGGNAPKNQKLDTSNLSTPIPQLPVQRRFTLGSLIPRWLIPGQKPNAGMPPSMATNAQQ